MARVLRGKHKAMFAPHIDTGDHVIVVNAAKVVLTAGKADKKFYYRHSGYPGGLSGPHLQRPAGQAARGGRSPGGEGHAPEGPARAPDARKLKVYAGPEHPSRRSEPQALALDHSAHRVA